MKNSLLTLKCIAGIRPFLKEAYGPAWSVFLLKSFFQSGSLFKRTKWAKKKDAESKFVKLMAIIPAFYLNFRKKFTGEQSMEFMKYIVHEISNVFDYNLSRKFKFQEIKDPFKRWLRYRSTLITESFGPFNEFEDVYISKDRMHFIVKRCVFHDFFSAVGTPELTVLICNHDQVYLNHIFKELYFDRNGSWKNTMGCGAKECHYVWKDRRILTKEFKEYLEKKPENHNSPDEKRQTERRQFARRREDRRQYSRRTPAAIK
ncbi:MAG: L-2-amino-thiazoline-4-carboxylic acid hydrolase [Spirochaetales bacterium]|nr:L-2-amino-thiazoline-4-carboxylic acid hydrolase [Spirochaetales bacterium]